MGEIELRNGGLGDSGTRKSGLGESGTREAPTARATFDLAQGRPELIGGRGAKSELEAGSGKLEAGSWELL